MIMSCHHRVGSALLGVALLASCNGASDHAAATNESPAVTTPDGSAGSSAPSGDVAPLPPPTHSVAGRVATVTLPYRTADGLVWVSATKVSEAAPFVFKGLDIRPGAGPGGTDLSVFTYEADKAGATTLKFGLVPRGKMLIGLPSMVYTGPVTARYEAAVSAQ